MTIPIIRKRAKHNKVRTGCRTCRQRRVKCDEVKPICDNCVRARRECAGYEEEVLTPQKLVKICPKRPCDFLLPPMARRGLNSLNGFEMSSLDFFRLHTSKAVPARCLTRPWDTIALQLAMQEPSLAYALAAVGCMHRAVTAEIPAELEALAMKLYNKALLATSDHISAITKSWSPHATDLVMLSTLIFFVFELYLGRDDKARIHLKTGLKILYETIQRKYGKPRMLEGKRILPLPPIPEDTIDVLALAFVRLELDLSITGDNSPYMYPVCMKPLPMAFVSIDEANVYLDHYSAVLDRLGHDILKLASADLALKRDMSAFDEEEQWCLAEVYSRFCDFPPKIFSRFQTLRDDLCAWMSAFAGIVVEEPLRHEHALTKLFFNFIWEHVESWRAPTEIFKDRYEEQYRHLILLAEEYLDSETTDFLWPSSSGFTFTTPPAVTIGTGFMPALHMMALNCRDSDIRWRCVALLRRINLHGVSEVVSCFADCLQRAIELEEQQARDLCGYDSSELLFTSHEIPEQARFLNVYMFPATLQREEAGILLATLTEGDAPLAERLTVRKEALTYSDIDLSFY